MTRTIALALASAITLAAVPAPVAAQARAVPNAAAYTINPGDEIEVYVWGEERLQRLIRILPDGTFSFPLVGQVQAAGKLPNELEAAISKGLESQYRGQVPQVTVSVRAPTGMQFSVMGRVKAAGAFTPGRYVNLLEALAMAGGPAEFANLDNISIVRKTPTGLVTLRAKLGGMFKNGVSAGELERGSVPAIMSGDTVLVP